MKITAVVLALLLVAGPATAQAPKPTERVDDFVASARAATARYQDQTAAMADGYRRIGPDFPTMGEHWLSIALAVRQIVDPLHPPILEYVTVGGKPLLAGVAYTQLVRDTMPGTAIPAPSSAWHFHQGSVDEESFILSHEDRSATAGPSGRPRIGVLHAWLWLNNPAGLFATDNWALPWERLGLAPPQWIGKATPADWATSLAAGGEGYFATLLRLRYHLTEEDSDSVVQALGRHARDIRALLGAEGVHAAAALESRLSDAWAAVEADLTAICGPCRLSQAGSHHF